MSSYYSVERHIKSSESIMMNTTDLDTRQDRFIFAEDSVL